MSDSSETPEGQPAKREAALLGLCPRCGERTLFAGMVKFAPRCGNCGLDFDQFNVGDGPAAFLITIVGGIASALAIWVEIAFAPPFWLHIILWVPLVFGLTVGGLRIGKGWLLQQEYRNRAREAGSRDL
ncbi:DUF983 domain-containing protein [Altererythrobacter sp. CAU 1778]